MTTQSGNKGIADLPVLPWDEGAIWSGRLSMQLARMAVEHGPIFRQVVDVGADRGLQLVYLVGPEANRFVMHTHRDHFSHEQGWTPVLGEFFGQGLLNMDDPLHARHRKMWNPAFTAASMAAYLPLMWQVIERRTATWPARGEVELYEEARGITFDIAVAALAGGQPGGGVDAMRERFYLLLHGFDADEQTWDEFMETTMRAQRELVELLLALIAERRAQPEAQQSRDVLGTILQARDEDGSALSDEQVLAHLNILLVAGHETTTSLAAWTLYLLATLATHYQRVDAEVAALPLGADGTIPLDTLRAAPALDAFVRETGRLYAPVHIVPRGVVKDVEFAGYTIPAGTQVRLALSASHFLPHVFANPQEFDPERFAPPRQEDRRHPYTLVTFGGGPRVCIGINFAQVEVKALAAHVLRTYRIEADMDPDATNTGYITAVPSRPLRLRAMPRT